MPELEELKFTHQDGTSQAGRKLKALDPAYVSVDERSLRDLLEFARNYAKELLYFNEQNVAEGDWSGFLGEQDNLDELVAYLEDPQRFEHDPQKKARFSRPHLSLFLTFLELLQQAQAHLNTLTRRHLEFYYREALRLTSRPGRPDRVHVLVQLADRQEQHLIPAGTLFQAGQDAQARPVFYRSEADLVANRVSVASVKSLFAARKIIGLAEARQTPELLLAFYPKHKDLLTNESQADRSFMAMLLLALGTPSPGASLLPYPDNQTVNTAFLRNLDGFLDFAPTELHMPFSTFRVLMGLKMQQDAALTTEWMQVNDYLQKIARTRTQNDKFTFNPSPPDNFITNLQSALSITEADYKNYFNTLPEVQDIYNLYRRCDQDEVKTFIQKWLYLTVDDFKAMMEIVETIIGRWRQIYEILRAAGKKKAAAPLKIINLREYKAKKFDDLLQNTLGTPTYPVGVASLDDYLKKLSELEDYFHMSAEEFVLIRQVNIQQDKARPWEWEQVYTILEKTRFCKVQKEQGETLKKKREADGFQALIDFVFGNPLPENKIFENLDSEQDAGYLRKALRLEPTAFTDLRTIEDKESTATEPEWDKVYKILEQTQPKIPAQIEDWENVYVAQDASQVQTQSALESETVTPRWQAFGAAFPASNTTPGVLGFALASPLLALAEGQRTITLTLNFQQENFNQEAIKQAILPFEYSPKNDQSEQQAKISLLPFQVLLSTAKGMVAIEPVKLELLESKYALQITLNLAEQFPPIVPLADGPWPVMKMLLADLPREKAGPQKRYHVFQHLLLEKIVLKVEVDGLSQLSLQNDNGLLDFKKPFEPFGMAPVTGSSFYFAHPELCSKKLDWLAVNIEWLGAPDDFSTYYQGYLNFEKRDAVIEPNQNDHSPINKDKYFKACLKLHDRHSSIKIDDVPLFSADKNNKIPYQFVTRKAITERDIQLTTALEVLDWSRYWQLELLEPDFQHSVYPRVAAECANKKVDAQPQPYIVNPPYTPKIKRLTIGYSSSLELDLTKDVLGQQADRLYYIEPFGYRDLTEGASSPYNFLPQFQNEGELFIGLADLKPPQNLNLLFQLAEGSADPNLEPEPVQWSFLDGDTWQSLENGRMLSDTTNGLRNSGIIKFDLPPVAASRRMPAGLYWLRATIARHSRSVADIVAIHTQAVSAIFADHENDPARLARPLAPGSVRGLAERQPQVEAVSQPYSSFGGKSPEQAGDFYLRASERLRHKNRALTGWDYEHLVLEAFPDIYKVKCLPVGSSPDPRLADVIQVIVIPNIQGRLPFDPFEPKLSADVLAQVETYLLKYSPPFARLVVKNPTYLRLRLRLGVRLRPEANPGYFQSVLNEELKRYLSPWAYDDSAEIAFGGQVNTSLIVNFLENRLYVDYVAGMQLFTSLDGQTFTRLAANQALASDVILVSDRSHVIDLIAAEGYEELSFVGINYMKIELDFLIA